MTPSVGTRPSVLDGTLVDITLTDGRDDRPSSAARPSWAEWYQGLPTEPNLWALYNSQGRAVWLHLTIRVWRLPAPRPDRSGGEYHLDGRFVTDVAGLHSSIAEALLGTGRYFGPEWNAFKDCLGGGSGVAPPFTLTWHAPRSHATRWRTLWRIQRTGTPTSRPSCGSSNGAASRSCSGKPQAPEAIRPLDRLSSASASRCRT
ncbi:barstar family protein [Streptomyces yangpuensis]|uniref:barstar family protein n=1 Tax=Streptomyces yangpuensis TaxID=1648182 RepID=UPI0036633B46